MSLCHSSDNFKYISFQFCPWEHLPTKLVVILLSPTQNIFISFSPHLSGISFLPTVWPAFLFTHLIHHSIVSGAARNLLSKMTSPPSQNIFGSDSDHVSRCGVRNLRDKLGSSHNKQQQDYVQQGRNLDYLVPGPLHPQP